MNLSEPVIYCCKPWHGHRETCAPANSPSAQTAQQVLPSRKSVLCHIHNPSLHATSQWGPEGERGIALHQIISGCPCLLRLSRAVVLCFGEVEEFRSVSAWLTYFCTTKYVYSNLLCSYVYKKLIQHPLLCLECLL